MTSYSCSATPISYESDEISRLYRLVFEIWRGTDRQTTDATTVTEGSALTVCEPNNRPRFCRGTGASDSEWQWHQLGHYANLHLDPDTTTQASHHSVFYRRMPFLSPNQQHQSPIKYKKNPKQAVSPMERNNRHTLEI